MKFLRNELRCENFFQIFFYATQINSGNLIWEIVFNEEIIRNFKFVFNLKRKDEVGQLLFRHRSTQGLNIRVINRSR